MEASPLVILVLAGALPVGAELALGEVAWQLATTGSEIQKPTK
jgi:hypothetical protein